MIPPLLESIRNDVREYFGLTSDTLWHGKDVVIVVGQNGAGKSVLRRLLKIGAKNREIRIYDFSQERRTGGGIENTFLYGDETWESTGAITLRTFRQAFQQNFEEDSILLWDEPEIGLSEETQLGLAEFILEQLKTPRPFLLGLVFMTHSRVLVKALQDHPQLAFVDLDQKHKTAASWAERKAVAAPFDEVKDRCLKRFRELSKLLKAGGD